MKAKIELDPYQAWVDEVQEIVCEFVQNDAELGELMLDHCQGYWDKCFYDGLTPRQALNGFIDDLKQTDLLERFKRDQAYNHPDNWQQKDIDDLVRLIVRDTADRPIDAIKLARRLALKLIDAVKQKVNP
jgi:hypothetical protein